MVVPLAIAAGRKAVPVAKTAARKAKDNPDAALLIGVIGLVVVGTMLKGISNPFANLTNLPGELLGDVGDKLGGAWNRFREFGEVDIPKITDLALGYPAGLVDETVAVSLRQSKSVARGFLQGDLDEDDPGPEYYTKTYYDVSGVPIAVPVETNRTAKGFGRALRRALGDWSIPGL